MKIYFDHNATTPCSASVKDAMAVAQTQLLGNPASVHQAGRLAKTLIDTARQQVADFINVDASQVIFTSGGTEANNLAIKGVCWPCQQPGLIAYSALEHKAVIESAHAMAHWGWQAQAIKVDLHGQIDMADYQKILQRKPFLISIMLANNETGVMLPIKKLAALAHQQGCLFHCDAVQAAAKTRIDMTRLGVDLLSLASHKIAGPSGVGALIIRPDIKLMPLLHGGGQESALRSGSHHVLGIVGFGKACELATRHLTQHHFALMHLQHYLEEALEKIEGLHIIAEQQQRLPNTTLIAIAGFDSEMLVMQLDQKGIAVSAGSACGQLEPSHVMQAMAVDESLANSIVRISFNADNTEAEIDELVVALKQLTAMAQQMAF